MSFSKILVSALCAAAMAQSAFAQQAGEGSVTYLRTEPGSVLVQRGGEVYQLGEGDVVMPGDLVFTRTNGAVRFSINGCVVVMGGQSSITVNDKVCTTPPVQHEPSFKIAGVQLGIVDEGTGATPGILAGLLAAGGAAAGASGGGNNNNPASP